MSWDTQRTGEGRLLDSKDAGITGMDPIPCWNFNNQLKGQSSGVDKRHNPTVRCRGESHYSLKAQVDGTEETGGWEINLGA